MTSALNSYQGPLVFALVMVTVIVAALRGIWSPCGLSMISAINPMSERARGHRYWLTAGWFVIGAVAGGAALGAVGALAAALVSLLVVPPAIAAALAALCCAVTLASDSGVSRFTLPLIPRQVNERWLSGYRRWVYASGFGAQIGAGLATYVMTAAVYLTPVLGALSGSPARALAAGLLFGFVRGLAITLTARVRQPAQLLALHRALADRASFSLHAAMAVQAVAVVLFAWFAAGWPAAFAAAVLVMAGLRLRRRAQRTARAELGGASVLQSAS